MVVRRHSVGDPEPRQASSIRGSVRCGGVGEHIPPPRRRWGVHLPPHPSDNQGHTGFDERVLEAKPYRAAVVHRDTFVPAEEESGLFTTWLLRGQVAGVF